MSNAQQDPTPSPGRPMRATSCAGLGLVGVLLVLALAAVLWFMLPGQPLPTTTTPPATPIFPATPVEAGPSLVGKVLPTATLNVASPVVPTDLDRRPIPPQAADDLRHLLASSPPAHDYFATAQRLGDFALGERQRPQPPAAVGDRRTFETADGPRQADLVYQTAAADYWVELGLSLDRDALAVAAQNLESQYLPRVQANFGREWSPGVDQDPRITILHVIAAADDFELGYFSDENEYPRSLFLHSNEREMIYLNMSRLEVGTDLYFGTLVHELQHLAQWNLDPNEQIWLNEGFSQLAETRSGLDTVDPAPYLAQPNIRLDRWSTEPDKVYAQYAGAYLFVRYLWQRLGEQAAWELVRLPDNGLGSVASVLAAYLPTADLARFAADWATANYLDSHNGRPPFAYDGLDLPSPALATRARRLPFSTLNELDQFAVDYVDLDLSGPVRLTFVGETTTALMDAPPGNGRFWYAALANSSAPSLTADLLVPATGGPALEFDLWYDLEAGWDVAYLSASADGGQTWRVLGGQAGTANLYGPGWSGRSAEAPGNQNGWVHERIDLGDFAVQPVVLRFDVLSDFERPSQGLGLANLALVTADGQHQPLLWEPDGFVETGALLPQLWGVRLIRDGNTPDVIPLVVDGTGLAQAEAELGPEGGAVIIMPLTSPSSRPARYWLSVESVAPPPN